jgi:hypothetical protein
LRLRLSCRGTLITWVDIGSQPDHSRFSAFSQLRNLGLDRDREASRDLKRLLDEPGERIYIAASRIDAKPGEAFPAHFTRVRTMHIGWPQHAEFATGRGLSGGSHLLDQLHQLDQPVGPLYFQR